MHSQTCESINQVLINLIINFYSLSKMKKKLGIFFLFVILGVALLNIGLSQKANSNLNLASIIAGSVANAETIAFNCRYSGIWSETCTHNGNTVVKCYSSNSTTCQY